MQMSAFVWLDKGDIATTSCERTRSSRLYDSMEDGWLRVRKFGEAVVKRGKRWGRGIFGRGVIGGERPQGSTRWRVHPKGIDGTRVLRTVDWDPRL